MLTAGQENVGLEPAYFTSWRNNRAGLMRFERARDRNHSRSYGEGSMCVQNASEQVRVRQAIGQVQTVFSTERLKPLPQIGFGYISSALVKYAG